MYYKICENRAPRKFSYIQVVCIFRFGLYLHPSGYRYKPNYMS